VDPDADDHYDALGVRPSAPTEEIERAWRFGVLAFHPDRFRDGAQRERAEAFTKRLNGAWEVLRDPVTRARYDRTRDTPRAAGPPTRAIPCPTCATVGRAPDADGGIVEMRCPACNERFQALVGGRMLDRPRLDGAFWKLRYRVLVRAPSGRVQELEFRRFPNELALATGEALTIVFRGGAEQRPRYLIRHSDGLDMAWRVD
jgi:hypothetical protein